MNELRVFEAFKKIAVRSICTLNNEIMIGIRLIVLQLRFLVNYNTPRVNYSIIMVDFLCFFFFFLQKPQVYKAWGTLSIDGDPTAMAFENKVPARFEKIEPAEANGILSVSWHAILRHIVHYLGLYLECSEPKM